MIDVGGHEVVVAITRHSVESLGLKEGDRVRAVIKAAEVTIQDQGAAAGRRGSHV